MSAIDPSKIDWSDLTDLYSKGFGTTKIAKLKGCTHYQVGKRLRQLGVILRKRTFYHGPFSSNYKKGRYETRGGYVTVLAPPGHPFADKNKRIYEHRLVMESVLGRYLLPAEVVHHKNGVRNDNRPENLSLVTAEENMLVQRLCGECELKKEIKLLQWQIKELTESLQSKLRQEG